VWEEEGEDCGRWAAGRRVPRERNSSSREHRVGCMRAGAHLPSTQPSATLLEEMRHKEVTAGHFRSSSSGAKSAT
jgi:hypothetical protein